ncbi:MAG: PilZ domain-containing protein [Burkholderiales bacterium]|nr:PilZ domain-containing protein [Burkholderiales bacterium]
MSNPIVPVSNAGIGSTAERRAHSRIAVSWAASLRSPHSLTPLPGQVIDVSMGGAAFASPHAVKPGDGYSLLLELAAGDGKAKQATAIPVSVLNCVASATGNRQHRVNLRFASLSPSLRQAIEQLVRQMKS